MEWFGHICVCFTQFLICNPEHGLCEPSQVIKIHKPLKTKTKTLIQNGCTSSPTKYTKTRSSNKHKHALSPSLSHTPTHTHAHARTHTYTHTHTKCLYKQCYKIHQNLDHHINTSMHFLSLPLSLSHTHTHTHTYASMQSYMHKRLHTQNHWFDSSVFHMMYLS